MGSPASEEGRHDDEGPQHEVTLTRGFWLADTPVTQALWSAVMGENPSRFQDGGDLRRPVEQVSWEDCQRLCEHLCERVSGPAFRLPTEAEWEFACRAGTKDATYAEKLRVSRDEIAWYTANGENQTHPVKLKLSNQWGLYDVLGNVWEWCSDHAYRVYSSAAQQNPTGPAAGGSPVVRGGSWFDLAGGVRAAFRFAFDPGDRDSFLGLRLARDQDQ